MARELLDRLTALVRAEPSRRIFAGQQLLLLFWLLIVDAREDDACELSPQEYGVLKAALLGCSSVVGDQTKRLHESTSVDEWLGSPHVVTTGLLLPQAHGGSGQTAHKSTGNRRIQVI